jgi:uncharacterized protein YegP (UPF0339 family)
MAPKFEIQTPKAGAYRWVLTSQGRTLAVGETYHRRALAEKAIVSFRMAAVNAPIVDSTVPAAKTTPGNVARATGRGVAKAVVTGAAAVEKVEKTARRVAKKAVQAIEGAAPAPRATGRTRTTKG